ncbi:MAG TPA: carbohydrate ABC transporter permease [Clostridia bacterium]|jgi:putative aldouronate transport system permease protein|nr:carbohydrate ABC transporter permease [Clostridia bacterium]
MGARMMKPGKRSSAAFGLSPGERALGAVNVFLLTIIGLMMVLPFLNTVAKSFSSNNAITTGKVIFTPVDFQLGTYKYVTGQSQFWDSLRVSVLITLLGTAGAMTISCLTAYPLSKTWLYGRKPVILFFVFTMLFSGGMVPNYLLMRSLGLINTLWVLFVPGMLSVYNVILLKNFFEDIPEAIEESAQLDGAGNIRTLISIVLPMSLPALATIGLFYAVGYWDNYMTGLLYITKPDMRPLQTYLYVIVTEAVNVDETLSMDALENIALNTEAIRAATIVLACVPIMCVYPFLQKYFVKGMRVGSVKG